MFDIPLRRIFCGGFAKPASAFLRHLKHDFRVAKIVARHMRVFHDVSGQAVLRLLPTMTSVITGAPLGCGSMRLSSS